MKDLLKEAIADAKAVRETALANAKIALEEAFTPRIQSMLSAKLAEEEEMEDEMEAPVAEPEAEVAPEPVAEPEVEEGMYETEEEEMPMEGEYEDEPVAEEEDMDLELEAILRELDEEDQYTAGVDDEGPALEEAEEMEDEPVTEEEEVSIEEVIRALREEDDMEDEPVTEEEEMDDEPVAESAEADAELEEAYKVITFLRKKINEVNLLNAKLLFSNKLFRSYDLNEGQKMKVIESFDRTHSVREVKLVYGTLAESFTSIKSKRKIVKESYASKPSRSTAPKKQILSEGNDLAARWKKLANLK